MLERMIIVKITIVFEGFFLDLDGSQVSGTDTLPFTIPDIFTSDEGTLSFIYLYGSHRTSGDQTIQDDGSFSVSICGGLNKISLEGFVWNYVEISYQCGIIDKAEVS